MDQNCPPALGQPTPSESGVSTTGHDGVDRSTYPLYERSSEILRRVVAPIHCPRNFFLRDRQPCHLHDLLRSRERKPKKEEFKNRGRGRRQEEEGLTQIRRRILLDDKTTTRKGQHKNKKKTKTRGNKNEKKPSKTRMRRRQK